MGTLQHYFLARGKQASIQDELHGHPVRGVVSCQQGRLDALGHGDSPSEEFRVKDSGGSLFQGLSRDSSELSDKAVDSAAATMKSGG